MDPIKAGFYEWLHTKKARAYCNHEDSLIASVKRCYELAETSSDDIPVLKIVIYAYETISPKNEETDEFIYTVVLYALLRSLRISMNFIPCPKYKEYTNIKILMNWITNQAELEKLQERNPECYKFFHDIEADEVMKKSVELTEKNRMDYVLMILETMQSDFTTSAVDMYKRDEILCIFMVILFVLIKNEG